MTSTGALILAHGFTQTARSWAPCIQLLTDRSVDPDSIRSVDMPGHGAATDARADLWKSADHLVSVGGPGNYIGYSMGGRVAMHAALSHPDEVEQLVLVGATPGIVDDTERRSRRAADELLADHIESVGVEQFIDEWLANPLFAGLTAESALRQDRLSNTAEGLASSLRLAGTGTQDPLWDRLGEISCPVLLVVGANDVKFRAIADQMVDHLPDASVSVIEGSGHSAHMERPVETVEAILGWLQGPGATE